MEAMDVDEDGSSQQLVLIRAVRTLDEDSSLSLPEKIHKIWLLLTAVKHTRLHGIEESILRWLLKQMSGNTDSAEHARRYPLAWTILGHVFPKIPAQSLGRSLSYLRFVPLLSKTLGDVTKHETSSIGAEEDTATAKKRKRGADWPAALAELRTPLGRLKSATEIFEALAILLEQGTTAQTEEVTPEKRVGAEHIKSLFSSSADDTRDITARLLLICDDSLSTADGAFVKGQQSWIDTVATIWNLRLHSKEDSLEFAKHIYERASLVLAKFKGDLENELPNHILTTCHEIWVPQLRRFLSTYFIRPARQRFAVDKNIDMMRLALEIAQKDVVASATVMWSIAARIPRDTSDPKSKIEHDAWAEKIFQVVVDALQPLALQRQNDVLSPLLDIALQTRSIPDTETLRTLYQRHVLNDAGTDWTLLSKILACDADVFVADEDHETIFDIVSKASKEDPKIRNDVAVRVILPLQAAFSNTRALAQFIVQWLRSLCAAEPVEQSIWFDSRIREHLATLMQTSFSSTQLLRLLERLESIPSKAGGLLVVLDGICAGLTDEATIANADAKILSMMDQKWEDLTQEVLALRWRIFGYLASWRGSDECNKLWKTVKSDIKPIIKKKKLAAAETYEAFACCYRLCLASHIGGKYEEDLIKLICTMLGRLTSSVDSETGLHLLRPYTDLVFSCLPILTEQPKQEVSTLTNQIVQLFSRVSQKLPSLLKAEYLAYVRPIIHNHDVVDEEPFLDALMAPFLDALDNSDNQAGWTQPHDLELILILLEFPTESWTRSRRKRIMGSWKKHKSAICSCAAKDSGYAVTVLRLLVKIMQQPTFYENMEFTDMVDVCSSMTTSDPALLSLLERFISTTMKHVLANSNELTQSYLFNASQYAESLKPKKHSTSRAQILLLKSLATTLSDFTNSSSERVMIGPNTFRQKLAELVTRGLSDFAMGENESSMASLSDEKINSLRIVLDAAQVASSHAAPGMKIALSGDTLTRLERSSTALMSRDAATAWKLRSFLMVQSADRYTPESFSAFLDEGEQGVEEELIYDFVDAYIEGKSQSLRDQLLNELIGREIPVTGRIGPVLAARRLLEIYQGRNVDDASAGQGSLDLAQVHEHFTSHLSQSGSLPHFNHISDIMLLLLDKHANAMTQYNVEATLTSVVEICSAHGPKIQGSKVAGEIFSSLFKLVALIIKRHRLRLSGHFHILLLSLRALLNVLLVDPSSSISTHRVAQSRHPPWLLTRLQPRHGERFARLLTLVCEPSAASVARTRTRSELDSATDVAKRAAGQYMYLIIEVYIKLQLEVEVSRDMRKALEVGIFSVLDITNEGCRKALNESLDASGRAVFRALFAEYRKFGKWKGV
ncbi:Urb2/Npa2 family-domain-containing protein [Xylaria bambusicola]|uniref:Urb2/Npa2 family-domain-containing protein n=1 Tax=Xylaria bambusicola TaxID=326684 RepID=UPI00200746E2|nr:Urb2/Npa2 family-domain-containing protein [Xylaria bambusicola]KAI0526615.1 Urb2/Npa2 family-domain-containing protein [Xylaria bambusicola]